MKRTVCLDFDGVCNTYDGWKGEDELFLPRKHLMLFICKLVEADRRVAIFSTRPAAKLEQWFRLHLPVTAPALIESGDLFFPERKPPADCYVDDRAVRFNGDFTGDILQQILGYKAHWEKMTLSEALANVRDGEVVQAEADGAVSIKGNPCNTIA